MKKLWAILAILSLTGCLNVNDFGIYESKMTLDPALKGQWKCGDDTSKKTPPSTVKTSNISEVKEFLFEDGSSSGLYQMKPVGAPDPRDPEGRNSTVYFKNLTIGPYQFVATTVPFKTLVRYEVKGDTAKVYSLTDKSLDLLNKNKDTAGKSRKELQLLDETAYKTITALPDTSEYWEPGSACERIQKPTTN